MLARVQVERAHQGEHHSDDPGLRLHGNEQGWIKTGDRIVLEQSRCENSYAFVDRARCDIVIIVVCLGAQDKYLTVAEALQAAVLSVLTDEKMKYKNSFYYWAAFISHGFADVKLDDALLDQIHERLEALKPQSSKGGGDDSSTDSESGLTESILTLTRDAYHRLECEEQTLSRDWWE